MQNKQIKAMERKARRRVSAQHVALKLWEHGSRYRSRYRAVVRVPCTVDPNRLEAIRRLAEAADWAHA